MLLFLGPFEWDVQIWANTTFFFLVSKGDQRKKTQKPKKAEEVQPNVLIGLFVHFPFLAKRRAVFYDSDLSYMY